MIKQDATDHRQLHIESYQADLVVVGGGLSGTCCAITAARAGIQVILVQDRPVLGGNSSSEVRLWVLGATSHMGNNNRWAREGGVIDEILLENTYRNPEGNPVIFDTVLLEKVMLEPNIRLLLNTAVFDVTKSNSRTISSVKAFCSQNGTLYELSAPLFCDASGDGVIAFGAGAAFRMGAESTTEFGEKFAPSTEYGELLGHSIYFYTKDTGKQVRFVPPAYALQDITQIPRYRRFTAKEQGCQLWWLEYGGRLDTVHDTETIKWELWKVVYGVWHYIKNSGNFPEADTMTLEWVGTIPGKRESRRFEGDYMICQQDIVEQRTHYDAVAFGGWSIDLHPADGVFSEKPGCNQWHSKGIYQIPYRCLYSRNITNLFIAGRIISATHVAFGSTRVMGTSAYGAQVVGMAAALCHKSQLLPHQLAAVDHIKVLQNELQKVGQYIPGFKLKDPKDLVQNAQISASSEFILTELPADGEWFVLHDSAAQLIPLRAGTAIPEIVTWVNASTDTELVVELRCSGKATNHTPEIILSRQNIHLQSGRQSIHVNFNVSVEEDIYVFICFLKNSQIEMCYSNVRISGVLSAFNKTNPAVSNYGKQQPVEDLGVDAFEFWCPDRRPNGKNIAMQISPGIALFSVANVRNGITRPTNQPNAWIADLTDERPTLSLEWPDIQTIRKIELSFDTDFDHPLETVLMHHPETIMPFCVQNFSLCNDRNERLYEKQGNYQTRHTIQFATPIHTRQLKLHLQKSHQMVAVSLMEIRCYQ
ncbi:FAD-dependent oxidoreductase [Xanthocytophaga agilis]|uniref:FAD-dependent oxidoreductase n=1 Tax=Xanthocytophaga agilis TaxID=3048010 RepID=A0AAE3UGA5_9BACT|nr:FAD-dependent oxidoreductase [Xanthocytophaga agilis]MDJ1504195.1 FAD-dependent oxidoreductase [Xanthocytophaga agilis]